MRKENYRERYDLKITQTGQIKEATRKDDKRRPLPMSAWAAFEFFGQVGLSIALPIVGSTLLGAYLDSIWHTKPTWTLAGLAIGSMIAVGSFILIIQQFKKRFMQ